MQTSVRPKKSRIDRCSLRKADKMDGFSRTARNRAAIFQKRKPLNDTMCTLTLHHVRVLNGVIFHCWLQLVLVKPAEVLLLLRYKLSSKGTCQKNFVTIRGCLDLHMTCVRTLGALKKEEEERRRRR